MGVFPGYIKVNLPSNSSNFESGNGEGVWVRVESDVEKLHDDNHAGGVFKGILGNDSFYYPTLKCGDTILFTMRGENRPVCIYHGFLDNMQGITEEERIKLIEDICKANGMVY